MTEEVEKKVCEGTVADLMKDKTGKQTVVTLTRKNAYRVKKIREQGTDNEAVLFHFRKRCTGMGSYVHTIETADGETELHPNEFEKWEAVEFLYPGYLEDLLDAAYNAYRWSSFEQSGKHIPMGLFIHKIKDYETTDYRKYQQACGNPGIGYRNTYADRQRYHAYRYDCTAPAHRRNHRISFQSSSTDCQDSIYLFHCRTPVFLTNKTYRYENKYMYIFRSCHAGCMATE